MPLPAYPNDIGEAAWKKAAGKEFAALEKDLGIGGALKLMRTVFDDIDQKPFASLENAIKSKEGGPIQSSYALVDAELPKVDKLARLAGEYNNICKKEAPALKKKSETTSCADWLLESGKKALRYPEELNKFGEKLLEDAEKVPAKKITDLHWDLNEWDLTHLLTKVVKADLNIIALPDKKPVMVTVTGKVGAEAAGNATLRAEFFEAAYAAAKKVAPSLKAELEDIEERFNSGAVKGNAIPQLMEAAFKTFEKEYAKQADQAIQKVWAELGKDKTEYRNYQIKTGISIGAKVGGIAVGVVTTVTTGWTGAGTILGVAAMLKSAVELVYKILDTLKEARALGEEITKDLDELKTAFAKDGAAITGGKEVGKDVLTRLTGFQTTCVKSVKENASLFGSKIQGCNVNSTKLGAEIDKTLKESDALAIKIRKAEDMFKNAKKPAIAELKKKHDELTAILGKLVATAADYKEDYKKGKDSLIIWAEQIKDLQSTVPELAQKIQKWAVPLLDFAFVGKDPEGAIMKAGALAREYLVLATDTEKELKSLNEVGDLAGDVSVMIIGLVGKH